MLRNLGLYERELLEALKKCRRLIRGELIEHAVIDTSKPNEEMGEWLDELINKYEPPDSPKVRLMKAVEKVSATLTGSGFDGAWAYSETNRGVWLHSTFHVMNDVGFYVGWAQFSLFFRWDMPARDFRLRFRGASSHYLARKHDLRDHIENSVVHLLPED